MYRAIWCPHLINYRKEPPVRNDEVSIILLKRLGIAIVAIAAVAVLYFIYSHGFLNLSRVSQDSPATLVKISTSLDKKPFATTKSNQLISSGHYALSTPLVDGGLYTSNTNIPTFLRTKTVDGGLFSYRTETIGRNSLVNIAKVNGSYISFEGADWRKLSSTSIGDVSETNVDDSFPPYIASKQISKDEVVGYIRDSANTYTPVLYNLSTKQPLYYPSITTTSTPLLNNDYSNFALLEDTKNNVFIYSRSKDIPTKISLSKGVDLSTNDGHPIYSVATNRFAITTGLDLVSSNDNQQTSDANSQDISVFSISSSKLIRNFSFKNAVVTGVALGPNGKSIAIQTPAVTGLYDIDSGKLLFTIPQPTNRFVWLSDTSFVYTTLTDGIFTGSLDDNSARSVVPYTSVRPTEFSFADGSVVYFSGYAGSINGTSQPSAYKADTSTLADNTSASALLDFPHQGNNYYVDFLNGVATIQTTRYITNGKASIDTKARSEGIQYVKEHLKGIKYTLHFTYVDFSTDDFIDLVKGD